MTSSLEEPDPATNDSTAGTDCAAKFSCKLCNKPFQWKSSLTRHVKMSHLLDKKYHECHLCNRTFHKQVGLSLHLKGHKKKDESDETPPKNIDDISWMQRHCMDLKKKISEIFFDGFKDTVYSSDSDCEYQIVQKVVKIRGTEPDSRYKCTFCNRMFVKKNHLERHMNKHKKDFQIVKKETCDQEINIDIEEKQTERTSPTDCKIQNTSPNSFLQHPITPSANGDRLTSTQSTDEPYSDTTKPMYPCTICHKYYLKKINLENHMAKHVSDCSDNKSGVNLKKESQGSVSDNPVTKPFLCVACGKRYTKSGHLASHMRIHSNYKPHLCSVCGKAFTIKRYLIVHQRIHTKERPFKCEHCNKGFRHKSNLIEHLRTHSGIKPHCCAKCGKTFAHYSGLTQHLLTHSSVKKHSCKLCGKAFRLGGQFREHMRRHTGDRPYVCNVCNRSFADSSSLVVHKRTHSGERPYKCSVCNKGFIKSDGLKQHKKTHAYCNIDIT